MKGDTDVFDWHCTTVQLELKMTAKSPEHNLQLQEWGI